MRAAMIGSAGFVWATLVACGSSEPVETHERAEVAVEALTAPPKAKEASSIDEKSLDRVRMSGPTKAPVRPEGERSKDGTSTPVPWPLSGDGLQGALEAARVPLVKCAVENRVSGRVAFLAVIEGEAGAGAVRRIDIAGQPESKLGPCMVTALEGQTFPPPAEPFEIEWYLDFAL